VFEHALDDAVGAFAVLGDLVEVAAQRPPRLCQAGHDAVQRGPSVRRGG
jgi:hypothetical protein